MDQSQMLAIGLVIMVIVGIIFAPPLITEFFKGLRDLFDEFRNTWFEDWGDGDNQTTTWFDGWSAIGFKIQYADGSIKEYSAPTFSILPLTLYDMDNKEIAKVIPFVYAKLEYKGTLQSFEVTGNVAISTYTEYGTFVQKGTTKDIDKSGTSWTSGEQIEIGSIEIVAGQIEFGLHESGNYQLRCTGELSITVTFQGAIETETAKSLESTLNIRFEEPEITMFSVEITTEIFNP